MKGEVNMKQINEEGITTISAPVAEICIACDYPEDYCGLCDALDWIFTDPPETR